MSIKSWVLDRMQRTNGLVGRADLPPTESAFDTEREPARRGDATRTEPSLVDGAHLGIYGALVAAIRDELEHFVASHVRLHLAIADRDRFVLTSIGVHCQGAADPRRLLEQFMHEFKPEQVKRYLVREVIGALPNAAAIDLSQFAGLVDSEAAEEEAEAAAAGAGTAGDYRELLAALRSAPVSTPARPYRVGVHGRWSELDHAASAGMAATSARTATLATPLAGQRREFDLEDGDGRRCIVLQAVVPGRRYVLGKGEDCDVRVNGTYTSRRHAEIWLGDDGSWWVGDVGSTNGIRVDMPGGRGDRHGPAPAPLPDQPLRLPDGARLVLSARAEGSPADYPWLALHPSGPGAARVTPIASIAPAPRTPLTAILPAKPAEQVLVVTAAQAGGLRTLELRARTLPATIGRSRNQSLVIDRRHEGVSGHHLSITGIDAAGASGMVHGDNGVTIDGVRCEPGARLRWQVGQTLVLGTSGDDPLACTLSLSRRD